MSEELKNPTAIAPVGDTALAEQTGPALGFEEASNDDIIIPRIKVINALSPERQDGIASEGDILNSLTKEKLNGMVFIPVKQYYSNIWWNPERSDEQRMFCRSFDGHIGQDDDGCKSCANCGLNKFDNTKQGRDAQPKCTAYINFLGFISGMPMPIILSFAKTNYSEGRKLLSMAKSMRTSIWNYGYRLESVMKTKGANRWFNIATSMAGATSQEDRSIAYEIYKAWEHTTVVTDYDDMSGGQTAATSDDVAAEI